MWTSSSWTSSFSAVRGVGIVVVVVAVVAVAVGVGVCCLQIKPFFLPNEIGAPKCLSCES